MVMKGVGFSWGVLVRGEGYMFLATYALRCC